MKNFSIRNFLITTTIALAGMAAYCFISHKANAQSPIINVNKERILVVYYSLPEADSNMNEHRENSSVTVENKTLGNTEYMATVIAQTLKNADIFRIETVTPYDTTDHAKLINQARDELNRNYRPALKASINNLEQYDVIFLGYPIWWSDMPAPLYSFLTEHDLSGKVIIPFGTHGGSGFSGTRNTIAKLQPNADVLSRDGLTISRDRIENAQNDIVNWLNQLQAEK